MESENCKGGFTVLIIPDVPTEGPVQRHMKVSHLTQSIRRPARPEIAFFSTSSQNPSVPSKHIILFPPGPLGTKTYSDEPFGATRFTRLTVLVTSHPCSPVSFYPASLAIHHENRSCCVCPLPIQMDSSSTARHNRILLCLTSLVPRVQSLSSDAQFTLLASKDLHSPLNTSDGRIQPKRSLTVSQASFLFSFYPSNITSTQLLSVGRKSGNVRNSH